MKMSYLYLFPAVAAIFLCLLLATAKGWGYQVTFAPRKPDIDVKRLLSAIKAVEGRPWSSVGPAGERSRWSITPAVWEQHSNLPHEWASGSDPVCVAEVHLVLQKHITWICDGIRRAGKEPTPYTIGVIYHGGLARWERDEIRAVDADYGKRISNLYHEKAK